jgi:solute carrier family 50 protein (sugar transporter)
LRELAKKKVFGRSALGKETGKMILGIGGNINLVFFYGAPLSNIAEVLRKQTSASIHIPTMITNTANSAFWTVYAIGAWDLYLTIPNGLGAVLRVIQIILCILFPREKKQKRTVEQPEQEISEDQTVCLEIDIQWNNNRK